jgi:hypothetical protein
VEQAARLLGAVVALRNNLGSPPRARGLWSPDTDAVAAAARAALGEERWAAAFAAGKALSLEEAVAEALDDERTR